MKVTLQALALCQSEEQTLKTSALLCLHGKNLTLINFTNYQIVKQEMVKGPMAILLPTHKQLLFFTMTGFIAIIY